MLTDVLGQDEGVRVLRRVAEQQYNSPLLLIGDEGVGRRFSIYQLGKEMFCDGTRQSGCSCFHCTQIDEGTHPDLITVTPEDDKEIKVDQIREVLEQSGSFPSIARLRLFLIDGADRMNTAAANAFLKTLEEPPSITRFFLLAEHSTRVIPTIQSRCGRVRFRGLPETFVQSRVSAFESDSNKALVYARMGEGSVGRAIRYWGSGRIGLRDKMFSLIRSGVQRDLPSIFSVVAAVDKDLVLGLRFLEHLLHDLLMVHHQPDRMINLDLSESIKQTSEKLSVPVWARVISNLRVLQPKARSLAVSKTLPFHVQNLFVESFFGV